MAAIEVNMKKDKTTKNSFRFTADKTDPNDPHTMSIYLTKAQCQAAGINDNVKVTIEAA